MKPNEKLILKTAGWSTKIRLSCSRGLRGLMVERRKLYQSVVAAKSGTDLGPVLAVRLSNIFVRAWDKVWRDKNWIRFPTGACSYSGCLRSGMRSGWWFWRCTRSFLVLPLRFFRSWFVIWSRSAAFTVVFLMLLTSSADMRVVRCTIVECFSTGCASKRTFGSSLVVRFPVSIESGFLCEPFLTAGAFVRFLSIVN